MTMTVLGMLLPALLLMLVLDAPSGAAAFSTPLHKRSITRLYQSSVSASSKKNKKKNKGDEEQDEQSSLPALPPALTLDGLTCSHDGGMVYQLKDVSYVLPRTA